MEAKSLPNRTVDRWLLVSVVALVVGLGGLVAACGGKEAAATNASATPTPADKTPTAVMSAAEIGRWKTDAIAFADRFYGAWPYVNATFANFADNAAFYDPTDGDFLITGKQRIVPVYQAFFSYFPDIQAQRRGMYLSADGAAYAIDTKNLWPPWVPEPAHHAPIGEIELFRFQKDQVTSYELWFSSATLQMCSTGCFTAGKGGTEELRKIVDRYVSAWSSGDTARIAALYRRDAMFTDSMLGIQAKGSAAIAAVGNQRFGSGGTTTFTVVGLYAQTNGPDAPTQQLPEKGAIIGVAIHYRYAVVANGTSKTVEGLTTFELGTRMGKAFSIDPRGLIAREEVFYVPDSLVTAGLAH
jgi:hypothetical protein